MKNKLIKLISITLIFAFGVCHQIDTDLVWGKPQDSLGQTKGAAILAAVRIDPNPLSPSLRLNPALSYSWRIRLWRKKWQIANGEWQIKDLLPLANALSKFTDEKSENLRPRASRERAILMSAEEIVERMDSLREEFRKNFPDSGSYVDVLFSLLPAGDDMAYFSAQQFGIAEAHAGLSVLHTTGIISGAELVRGDLMGRIDDESRSSYIILKAPRSTSRVYRRIKGIASQEMAIRYAVNDLILAARLLIKGGVPPTKRLILERDPGLARVIFNKFGYSLVYFDTIGKLASLYLFDPVPAIPRIRPSTTDVAERSVLRPRAAGERQGDKIFDKAKTSVVNLGDYNHVLVTAAEAEGISIEEQTRSLLLDITTALERGGTDKTKVITQNVYLRDISQREACEAVLAEYYDGNPPATNFVQQLPANGDLVAIQILAAGGENIAVERKDRNVTLVQSGGMEWVHIGGIEPDEGLGEVYDQVLDAFGKTQALLEANDFKMENVLRTWLYLRDIFRKEGENERYAQLNLARQRFFTASGEEGQFIKFGNGFIILDSDGNVIEANILIPPASTGIGTSGESSGFLMGCVALRPASGVRIQFLENPAQISAYAYPEDVLEQAREGEKKASPLFSRGLAVMFGNYKVIFISGTASIRDRLTVHEGDVEKQTETTMENMGLVLGQGGATLENIAQLTVYVKNQEDYEKVRRITEARFPNVQCVYLIADVCRESLLVEIEAVAYVQDTLQARAGAFARQLQESRLIPIAVRRMQYLVYILGQHLEIVADGFTANTLIEFLKQENLLLGSLFPNTAERPLYKAISEALNLASDKRLLARRLSPGGRSTYVYYKPPQALEVTGETILMRRISYLLDMLERYPAFGVNGFTSEQVIGLMRQNDLFQGSPIKGPADVRYTLNTAAGRGLLVREPMPGKSTYVYYRPGDFSARARPAISPGASKYRAASASILRPVAEGERNRLPPIKFTGKR